MQLSKLLIDYSSHTAGIDLCSAQIRFVQLRRHGKKIELVNYGHIDKAEGTFFRTDVVNIERAAKIIRTGLAQYSRAIRAAYASIPEQHSFLKLLTVPASSSSNLDESIRWETTQHIPYELKQLTIDWMRVPTTDTAHISALVAACPTQLTDTYRSLIERAGLLPFGLEPASVALARCHQHLFGPGQTGMLVSLGELESVAVVMNNGLPNLAASIPFTTESLISSFMQRFNIGYADARKSLYSFGFYKLRVRGLTREMLMEPFEQLVKRLQDVSNFSQSHFGTKHPVSTIFICGPGTMIAGLSEELSNRMKAPVTITSPLPGIVYGRRAKGFANVFQEYTVPLGLAMNSIDNPSQ